MQTYADETKARVVMEWMAGAGVRALSRQYKIPLTTLTGWVKGLSRTSPVPKKETRSIQELAGELAAESFRAQIAILQLAQDRTWLERQDASSLGVLFGINADKLYRLLPAFEPPTPQREPGRRDVDVADTA